MSTPIYHIRIRRDAHTTTPVQVPAHEVALLQTIFGEENVHNLRGQPVIEAGMADEDLAGSFEATGEEFERLAAKYGGNEEGLYVEQVYGKKAGKGLENALEKAQTESAAKKAARK
jgi:hypothetical protein